MIYASIVPVKTTYSLNPIPNVQTTITKAFHVLKMNTTTSHVANVKMAIRNANKQVLLANAILAKAGNGSPLVTLIHPAKVLRVTIQLVASARMARHNIIKKEPLASTNSVQMAHGKRRTYAQQAIILAQSPMENMIDVANV